MIPAIIIHNYSVAHLTKQIYDSDPLNHSWVSFITAVEVVTGGEKLLAEGYKTFNVPLLITHGTQDKLTCPKASRQFFELVPVADEDKEYVSIQGGLHEMHNDEEKDQVISIWINWIKKRAEAKTPLVRPPVSPTVMKT